ncbi:SLBB domain-containing protein [Endozoicomonas elysicola]|uniref:SLBB domain-containing protein n=1 Tax=Endozoicomonas elysicola TaxID=305900 RepID=UPI0003603F97|nr:SLBB domain-containing protein [Endozoicomonas elysicola]
MKYFNGEYCKNTIYGYLFFLLLVLSTGLSANSTIEENGVFFIELSGNDKSLPALLVSENVEVNLPDGTIISLSNHDSEQAASKILKELSKSHDIKSVKYFDSESLLNIAVLGDIQSPGKYRIPVGSHLNKLNFYHPIYDDMAFNANYTVIRGGQQIKVSSNSLSEWGLKLGDAVLISLDKRHVEKTEKEGKDRRNAKGTINEDITKPIEEPVEVSSEKAAIESEDGKEVKNISNDVDAKSGGSEITSSARVRDPERYKLQSGDILVVGLPGEEGFNKNFLIGRDGTIHLPEIGQLKTAGLTLREVEKVIYTALSDAFLGLDNLTIQLKEKRLLVTVLGFVNNPGEVELPSTGNIQMAITEAGGFVDGAQLDKLQLRRDGKKNVFNFKRYLDTGDPNVLPEIKSLDEIFVPTSPGLSSVHGEPRVVDDKAVDSVSDRTVIKVFGEVLRPVSFPYLEGINVVDAILKGGGVTRYANVEQVRVLSGSEPQLFNLKAYLDSGKASDLPLLQEGATVYVPKQVDSISGGGRTVYVMGQVQKPGAYETAKNVSFLDVLANAGGPNRYADIRSVRILRRDGSVLPFNLQDFTEGRSTALPPMEPGDAVFFPEKGPEDDKSWLKLETDNSLKILGAIKKPGRYEWAPSVDFMDYISNAGGPTAKADLSHVKIIKPGPDNQRISIEFNLQEFIDIGGQWSDMPKLSGGSTIVVPELPVNPTSQTSSWVKLPKEAAIYIMGAVIEPGRYAFNEDMGFLDILSASEGPSEEADLSRIRVIHRNEGVPKVSKVNLLQYFETGDESLLPKVKAEDTIFIASRKRKWVEKHPEDTVRIMGSVFKSGRYEFTNNMTILDLIAEAGGPKETAYIEKILIVNSSCCESRASTFDLVDFMKDPDASRLPILRAGDTVFVPELSQSNWNNFNDLVADTAGILNVLMMLTNLGWLRP